MIGILPRTDIRRNRDYMVSISRGDKYKQTT